MIDHNPHIIVMCEVQKQSDELRLVGWLHKIMGSIKIHWEVKQHYEQKSFFWKLEGPCNTINMTVPLSKFGAKTY